MPELPEVETILRGLTPHIQGATIEKAIIRTHQLRWPIPELNPFVSLQTIIDGVSPWKVFVGAFEDGHDSFSFGDVGPVVFTNGF